MDEDGLEAGFPKSSNAPDEDEVWSAVDELFAGRVGAAYDSEVRAKIFEEGKQRYADRIPPGCRDQGKSKDEEKYGDLLLWFQMLDKAEQETRPILFVTNDQKEDWWWKSQGKVIGPRGELVEEMRRRAGVPLYMYQSDRFMEQAGTFLNQQVSKEAIQDAHELAMLEAEEEREEALRELAGAVAASVATEALEMGTAQIPSPSVFPDVAAAHAARELLNSPEVEAAREFLNSPTAQAAREFMDSPAAQAARKALDSPEVREMRRLMNSPEMQEFRRMQRYFKHQGL